MIHEDNNTVPANWFRKPSGWEFWLETCHRLSFIAEYYGTRRFITMFTRPLHWTVFWARWIQSTPTHPLTL